MRPVSASEFAASRSGVPPEVERVSDGVWTVPMLMHGGHIPCSLGYLVLGDDREVHVIDPGWDLDENWAALEAALARIGRAPSDIASVVATHLHRDHLGMAQRIRRASGATIAIHRFEQETLDGLHRGDPRNVGEIARAEWGVPAEQLGEFDSIPGAPVNMLHLTADVLLEDNDVVAPGHPLRVVWTPGHTGGQVCLVDHDSRLIMTGDHVLPTMFPGLGLGGTAARNPLASYLDALRDVEKFDDLEVCPGHGYRFFGLRSRCAATAAHHLRRSREVADALAALDDPSVWDIASRVNWSAGWENLHGYYRYSALAQTAMHVEYLRETRDA
jgi:glyoxylase-like metal-dependent hydrolase (beta-lactamase superfamily II)